MAAPLAGLALLCVAAPAHAYVYWTQGNGSGGPIGRANLEGTGVQGNFITRASSTGIAVDGAHIYWTNTGNRTATIGRANLDGTGVDRNFITLSGPIGASVNGIAVEGAHIYWTYENGSTATIGRANLDGSGVNRSFVSIGAGAFAIAVDAAHIFWASQNGTIGRASLDGSNVDQSLIAGAGNPTGVAVDGAYVYWTNFGSRLGRPGTIGRAQVDGTGVNPRFITGATSPLGIAVDGTHVYWANYLGTIGRANLDGKGVDQSFISKAGASDIAVDGLGPAAGRQAAALNGAISIVASGGTVHGYTASLSGVVGTQHPVLDNMAFGLTKRTGNIVQSYAWDVELVPREVKINRTKASIEVDDPLGAGGADGELHFTFSGLPHRQSLSCGAKHDVVHGTLTGTLRTKVGDRFFKTVTVTRMTGMAVDTPSPAATCLEQPCGSALYLVQASRPMNPTKPVLFLNASTPVVNGRQGTSVDVSVYEPTAGTPFSSIYASIATGGTASFYGSNPNLSSARVSAPGGELGGSLSFKSSGAITKSPRLVCKGGHYQLASRPATVTAGRITARFDSIGKVSFDADLNSGSLVLERLSRLP